MQTLKISTDRRNTLVNITTEVQRLVRESGVKRGICTVQCPHTTGAITVQEGYDPDVARDILQTLERLVPHQGDYRHGEGNSDSHIKALLTGNAQTLAIEYGELQLGRWQQVFFCEYDGPRHRNVWVQIVAQQEAPRENKNGN